MLKVSSYVVPFRQLICDNFLIESESPSQNQALSQALLPRIHPTERVAREQRFSDPACRRRSKPLLDCRRGIALVSPGARAERDGRAVHHLFRETLLR